MWQALIYPAMQMLNSQNQQAENQQRQQMAQLYGQQEATPLQRFGAQNNIDPALFGDLFKKRQQQQVMQQQPIQPMPMTEEMRPYSGQPTNLEYLA